MNPMDRTSYSRGLLWLAALLMCGCETAGGSRDVTSHAMVDGEMKSDSGGTSAGFAQAMMSSMAGMNHDMMAAPMTGDPDHDFAAMMIPHHQGAIDMAKPYLLYGKDPALRRLAQEIIVSQAQETDVMRLRLAALDAHQGTSAPVEATSSTQPATTQPATTQAAASRDRVYTGDQTSNTVSVIDPSTNKLLGVIRLGDPFPGALAALYRGQLLVHGLGFSPDHKTLAAISIGSNSVTFIDTATNKVRGVTYVGRSPHEAFFTPDGKELWVCVRGEDYIAVLDAVTMKETRRVQTADGPGMVLFRPDGRFAFVPSSFTPELDVVDTATYLVIARVPQASPFSPNLSVAPDGSEVWFTLKDSGKTQVMTAATPFRIIATLNTGPLTNHVTLIDNENGRFAYVSVGAQNVVKVFRRGDNPDLIATIPTGDLPHGLWASPDGRRVYVGLENQDAVSVIDTLTNAIIATIKVGQQPQALVYVKDAVPSGAGTEYLTTLGDAGKAAHLTLESPAGVLSAAHATVSINELGPLDLVQIAASGVEPSRSYTLWLAAAPLPPYGQKDALVTFKTNLAGAQVTQAIGSFRRVLTSEPLGAAEAGARRFLLVTPADSELPVLIQVLPAAKSSSSPQ